MNRRTLLQSLLALALPVPSLPPALPGTLPVVVPEDDFDARMRKAMLACRADMESLILFGSPELTPDAERRRMSYASQWIRS